MRKETTRFAVIAALAVLALTEAASAYYSPAMGRFISRDPINEPGAMLVRQGKSRPATAFLARDPLSAGPEDNVYSFVANRPFGSVDALGLLSWDVNEKSCTITLKAKIQFAFTGSWTTDREQTFQNLFDMHVKSTFNGHSFRIHPNPAGYVETVVTGYMFTHSSRRCCPCLTSGWHPRLDLSYGWFNEDFLISVAANPTHVFMRSWANLGGPNASLDEGDVYMRTDITQIPAVHEFGHLLGLDHPGQALVPPAAPNSPGDYSADPTSLMGSGMQMRSQYFNKWVNRLDSEYPKCSAHACR